MKMIDETYVAVRMNIPNVDSEVLDSILGQLSDGLWENSRAKERYWKHTGTFLGEDGFCRLAYKRNCGFAMVGKSETEINKKYGAFLKAVLKEVYKNEYIEGNKADANFESVPFQKWFTDKNTMELEGYIGYSKRYTIGELHKIYRMMTK